MRKPVLVSALGHPIVIVPSPYPYHYGVFICDRNGNWISGSWHKSKKEAQKERSNLFKLHRNLAASEAAQKEGVE